MKEDINEPTSSPNLASLSSQMPLILGGIAVQQTAPNTQVSLTAAHPGRVSLSSSPLWIEGVQMPVARLGACFTVVMKAGI